jgi:hypothetical protein
LWPIEKLTLSAPFESVQHERFRYQKAKATISSVRRQHTYLAVPLMIVPDICPPAVEDVTSKRSNARENNPAAHVQLLVERTIANFL